MTRRARGVTLLEAVVSIAMLGVSLAIITTLFVQTSRSLNFEEGADAAMREMGHAAGLLSGDVEQADPASLQATGRNTLLLDRVAAADAIGALPLAVATPVPTAPRLQAITWTWDTNKKELTRRASGVERLVARLSDFTVQVDNAAVDEARRVEVYLQTRNPAGAPYNLTVTAHSRIRPCPGATVLP